MILLFLSVAAATSCDPLAALASLRLYDDGAREAYLCLADHADGATILTTALDAEAPLESATSEAPPVVEQLGRPAAVVEQLGRPAAVVEQLGRPAAVHARTTRCLSLWLLEHADSVWDPALVRRLSPDDRRLLADGIFARRGRASPSPDHAKVFAQFAWYQPDPRYTDNRLGATDRANIALADQPPPAPPRPPPPAVAAAAPPASPGGCACISVQPKDSTRLAALLGLSSGAALLRWRRRAGPLHRKLSTLG